jgi:hypothetical protein
MGGVYGRGVWRRGKARGAFGRDEVEKFDVLLADRWWRDREAELEMKPRSEAERVSS